MKINLGTTSDISNVKAGSKLDGKSEQSSDDADGFFSKLAALFSGADNDKSQVSSSASASKGKSDSVDGDKDVSMPSVLASDEDSQDVGKVTESKNNLDATDILPSEDTDSLILKSHPTEVKNEQIKNDKIEKSQSDSITLKSDSDGASVLMNEGKDILQRLNEANKTLTSGKSLPQEMEQNNVDHSDDVILTTKDSKLNPELTDKQSVSVFTESVEKPYTKFDIPVEQPENKGMLLDNQFKPVTDDSYLSDPDLIQMNVDLKSNIGKNHLDSKKEITPEEAALLVSQSVMINGIPYSVADLQKNNISEEQIKTLLLHQLQSENEGLQKNIAVKSPQILSELLAKKQPSLEAVPMALSEPIDVKEHTKESQNKMLFVDSNGQVFDLDKLDHVELDKLAKQHGKTVSQLLASAMKQMNGNQLHSSQLINQISDKQALNTVVSPATVDANANNNSAMVGDIASLITQNMAKTLEPNNKLNLGQQTLDIHDVDGSKSDKDNRVAQAFSVLGSQGVHSLSQLSKLDSASVQTPIQVNKDVASEQLAERVHMMMSKNLKHIDIRLDPPDLGKVHIRMHMNGDTTSVHFTVASHHARDALESSMPRLREMLSQQGVQIGDTAVQQQSSQQQNGYAASGGEQSQNGRSASDSSFNDENDESDVKLTMNVHPSQDGISYYA